MPSYRFMKYLGAGLEFYYGAYDGTGDPINMGLMVGPIAYLPIGDLDIFAGVGLGWARIAAEVQSVDFSADGFGLSIQAGAEYRIIKNLGIGAMFRMQFNFADEFCGEQGGQEACMDVVDISHNMIIGGKISAYF